MTAEDVEQQIRRHPTANERFLLGLLDGERGKVAWVRSFARAAYRESGTVYAYEIMRACLSDDEVVAFSVDPGADLRSIRES